MPDNDSALSMNVWGRAGRDSSPIVQARPPIVCDKGARSVIARFCTVLSRASQACRYTGHLLLSLFVLGMLPTLLPCRQSTVKLYALSPSHTAESAFLSPACSYWPLCTRHPFHIVRRTAKQVISDRYLKPWNQNIGLQKIIVSQKNPKIKYQKRFRHI